ncbi:hypothetical protein [Herbidospora mongoliensis]|uniref:hypothetical protein n=1 Tax=Herbidospora mongoliensis TaxID=688067 RepID=UPI00082D1680|nr:hypothetical protein [Herbidospora mongoliensis]
MTPEANDTFGFEFDGRYRRLLDVLGIRPATSGVVVSGDGIRVRFGPWELMTGFSNLAGVEITGPYTAAKAIGPRVSLADRGLTFGTNTRRGVCLRFHRPVPGGEPTGLLRHPGLTVTVADPQALVDRLRPYVKTR